MINVSSCVDDFPILKRKVNGQRLIYLDSTATTQKPRSVINAIVDYYENYNANVHRSVYKLGEEATDLYEGSREKVANFIGAKREEIVFTRNTTESINLLSYTLGESLKKGERILVSAMEHHSNILPWMRFEDYGISLDYAGLDDEGHIDMEDLKKKMTRETKIVSIAHESNVLGTINQIDEIGKMAKENGSIFIVDAAQSVPHMPFRVTENTDFVAFSGHKMLGPMGIGVLYGKYELLDKLPPFNRGGEMIKDVDFRQVSFEDPPLKFEAGTPNVAGAVGLSAAIDYLNLIGMENVRAHEISLISETLDALEDMKYVKYYGPRNPEERGGLVAFNVRNSMNVVRNLERNNVKVDKLYHSHDVASYLDEKNVYVRSGHHCAEPLARLLNISGSARASFYVYNTHDDVKSFIDALGGLGVQ
jgi:cysteine desulfurase/selenocysteine lyase